MTTDAPDGRADPIDAIFRSLDDSGWGRQHLPRLVALLTHDRARVRTGAGWAITFVAEERPDTAPYLIRRLGDRLADDDVPLTVEQAFLAVAARYPDVVEEELPETTESDGVRQFDRDLGGAMLRADYAMGGDRNRDVGRVRFPRNGDADDQQRVYTNDGDDDRWRIESSSDDGGTTGEGGVDADDDVDADEGGESLGGSDDEDDRPPSGRPARELWARTNHLAVIAANCRFDDLAVMAQRHRGRYADVYRTRADLDGEELAVGLTLFHAPEGASEQDVEGYVADLDAALARWDRVDGVEGIRTLYDWGSEPRPWALVEYAEEDLWDRDRLFSDTALWNAQHLATALTHVHENGVVHAGVDPGNVSYYGNLLAADERQTPMLTNVGLLSVVRQYFDPTSRLDPRYAAPEYFDRRYGRIDHASDIYGLGAVCYRLFTGRPPYRGDYASIRDAVLSPTPPRPSAVADVPEGVDDIVGKAMATEKLHRYEGVTHMAADLRAIARQEDAAELLELGGTTAEGERADADAEEGDDTDAENGDDTDIEEGGDVEAEAEETVAEETDAEEVDGGDSSDRWEGVE